MQMEEVASEDKGLRDAMAKLAGFMRRGSLLAMVAAICRDERSRAKERTTSGWRGEGGRCRHDRG